MDESLVSAPAPRRAGAKRPRLPECLWPEIAARAEGETLRALAAAYGVSHETIRAIVRRVRAGAAGAALRADEGALAARAMDRAA